MENEILWGAALAEFIDPILFLLLMGLCWTISDRADTLSKGHEKGHAGFDAVSTLSLAGIVASGIFFGMELSDAVKAVASPEFHGFVLRRQ